MTKLRALVLGLPLALAGCHSAGPYGHSVNYEPLGDEERAVTGVREYPKSHFPAKAIYAATDYAALRLITCGGVFDYATGHYLSSTVVFASLVSSQPA